MLSFHIPSGLPAFTDHTGEFRLLASKPDTSTKMKAAPFPVKMRIPQSQWFPTNYRAGFDFPNWIFDQKSYGECVGCGWAGALSVARYKQGMKYIKLSSGALYAQINGGSDNGAVISDAGPVLQSVGTCTFDKVGIEPIYLNQLPSGWQQEAARFKLEDMYQVTTWEDLGSAFCLGYQPVYGYMVGDNFEQFDANGVAGRSDGPGNHCNFGLDLIKLPTGDWAIYNVNSWSPSWGPFKNGCCILSQAHLFSGGDQPDICVIRAANDDPQGDNPPVAA